MTKISRTPEYYSYRAMLTRCYCPKHQYFHNYGGRGITVCERWRESFLNFIADMGPRPAGHTLDRINNDGNYEPDNCRWATRVEQEQNKADANGGVHPNSHSITFNGETMGLRQWSLKLGIHHQMISNRLRKGWTVEAALTTPGGHEGRRAARLMRQTRLTDSEEVSP